MSFSDLFGGTPVITKNEKDTLQRDLIQVKLDIKTLKDDAKFIKDTLNDASNDATILRTRMQKLEDMFHSSYVKLSDISKRLEERLAKLEIEVQELANAHRALFAIVKTHVEKDAERDVANIVNVPEPQVKTSHDPKKRGPRLS